MPAIEKAKDLFWCEECNSMVTENHRCEQWSYVTRIPSKAVIAIKALAALDAEKPAEDAGVKESVLKYIADNTYESGEYGYAIFTDTEGDALIEFIQQYAQSYHSKHCAMCKDIHLDDMRHGRA